MNEVYLSTGAGRMMATLGKLLGEGAAGKVHALPDMPGCAAKIYHGEAECRRHEAKIDRMLAHPPELPPALHNGVRYPQIAWPEAKLFDRAGRFVGFVMPEIDFRRSTSLVNLLQKSSRRIEKLSDYYGYRVLVARNLASVFAELHRAGHHMIDMKPANLRFYPDVSWMAVVDTDGFSIAGGGAGRMPAEQVSDEYIAPESWKKKPGELGLAQDQFALAVIIFQLLNNGVHPFAGGAVAGRTTHATDLQARIVEGLYPYATQPRPGFTPSTASIHKMFRRATRGLFDRAFLPGGARPSAAEWRDHLDVLVKQLVPCSSKPSEHAHFGLGCGFCAHEARIAASAQAAARKPAADRVSARRATPAGPARRRPAPIAVRTMPRPMPVRPVRKRRRGGVMALWPLALLVAMVGLASDELWQIVIPGQPGVVRAAGLTVPADDSPPATISTFASARDYLILPVGGSLAVELRQGPGDDFALIDELQLHDAVIGRGRSVGDDGQAWIWVRRAGDGASGFVPETALLRRSDAALAIRDEDRICDTLHNDSDRVACKAPDVAAAEARLDTRYRVLLSGAAGGDRALLLRRRSMWEARRDQCRAARDEIGCRREASLDDLSDLGGWIAPGAAALAGDLGAATAPPASLIPVTLESGATALSMRDRR